VVEIHVWAELASLTRLREPLEKRLTPRADDSFGVYGRELGIALELANDAGQEAAVQRIRKRAGEVA
jgi:hypothetical protein